MTGSYLNNERNGKFTYKSEGGHLASHPDEEWVNGVKQY
jgi:hypothetical protein